MPKKHSVKVCPLGLMHVSTCTGIVSVVHGMLRVEGPLIRNNEGFIQSFLHSTFMFVIFMIIMI